MLHTDTERIRQKRIRRKTWIRKL